RWTAEAAASVTRGAALPASRTWKLRPSNEAAGERGSLVPQLGPFRARQARGAWASRSERSDLERTRRPMSIGTFGAALYAASNVDRNVLIGITPPVRAARRLREQQVTPCCMPLRTF